jgi:hypothetical protein
MFFYRLRVGALNVVRVVVTAVKEGKYLAQAFCL